MTSLTLAKARRRAKWQLAIHEAGHAVVAMRLGVQVTSATIEPDGIYAGHVNHEHAPTRDDMLIVLAGPVAERQRGTGQLAGSPEEEASIWSDLAEYAEETGIELDADQDERQLQLRELYTELNDEVVSMIREDWSAIESVALALIERGTLNGRQIAIHAVAI
jgi:hypothetical protein